MLKTASLPWRWARPRFLESAPVIEWEPVEAVRQAMRDLVQALAPGRGESGAREALAEVDGLLRRGWPGAPVSRMGSLG
jgi:hypothetical protein